MPDRAAFARKLQAFMDAKGWNQSEFARAAGLKPYHISNYIQQRAYPHRAMLLKIAEVMGERVEALGAAPEMTPGSDIGVPSTPQPQTIYSVREIIDGNWSGPFAGSSTESRSDAMAFFLRVLETNKGSGRRFAFVASIITTVRIPFQIEEA